MAFNLKHVLQALLFSSSRPLSIKEIQATVTRVHEGGPPAAELPLVGAAKAAGGDGAAAGSETPPGPGEPAVPSAPSPADEELFRDVPSLVTLAQIRDAMNDITLELRAADGVLLLTETAQGFRLVTHPRFARWVRALRDEPPPVKLSQSAMETLAVIAYRQPVTRAEIEHIRGVSADAGLERLLERELIQVVGRADLPGRPIQYGTTEAFLDFIGARSLGDLPASDVLSQRQIDSWLQNAMNPAHPSDREMGLSEEGEEQLSLADAARAAGAKPAPASSGAGAEAAEPAASGSPDGGVPPASGSANQSLPS